ncbi:hypothetical protein [Blastochloris tepida]|uniref:Uncharacterized protein n=1 Tax=Blastochloris tepida TaxID=2233851 RepID=A0A348FZV3_9HYPH|nr:hypothetical protein [Blastochloris tepida]BBF92836.1 hypothetical protein BLTE_15210 [Blastochloris tepida]
MAKSNRKTARPDDINPIALEFQALEIIAALEDQIGAGAPSSALGKALAAARALADAIADAIEAEIPQARAA